MDAIVSWARRHSLSVYPFAGACCGPELQALVGPRYDLERFGVTLPHFSPRQADLLMVVGTLTQRQAPILRKVYDQMAEPKWVAAVGACVCSAAPYDNYATVPAVESIVPIDVYIAGCPPRPEALLRGLQELQEIIAAGDGGRRPRHRELDELPLAPEDAR